MELCDFNLDDYILGVASPDVDLLDHDRRERYQNSIMEQVLKGIEFIHSHDEVHRDLKPGNSTTLTLMRLIHLLVLYSRREHLWKVSDFGYTSKGTSVLNCPSPQQRGTEVYRAPELLQFSHYSDKVDIWALVCILFKLVTKRTPFSSDWEVFLYSQEKAAVPDDDYHVLSNSIRSTLEIDPVNRPSARELRVAFTTIVEKCGPFGSDQTGTAASESK
jgi:serine/threonine protein kinase